MIQMQGLNKYYNKNKPNECHALKDINLNIADGDMVAIMGKSGAGKSTLLHILAGIDKFDSGEVTVGKTKLSKISDFKAATYRNKTIGIVLQDFGLIDDYTVLDNILVPLDFASISHKEAQKRAGAVLSSLGISDLRKNKASELSGGQRQRVAIARAIVNKPQYLLADEPTGALDVQTTEEIMSVFKELNDKGITVIIVTHDLFVADCCKRLINICDGTI